MELCHLQLGPFSVCFAGVRSGSPTQPVPHVAFSWLAVHAMLCAGDASDLDSDTWAKHEFLLKSAVVRVVLTSSRDDLEQLPFEGTIFAAACVVDVWCWL